MPVETTTKVDGCPPGYGGCSCQCHYWQGVKHFAPCCYPQTTHSLSDTFSEVMDVPDIDWDETPDDLCETTHALVFG